MSVVRLRAILLTLPFALIVEVPAAERDSTLLPDNSAAVPPGLSASDWGSIRSQYERHRHSAVASIDGQVMRNPGQQWQTHFDDTGFIVQPDKGDWTWGLELKSYGFSGHECAPVPLPRITTNGPRVAYDRDDTVQEWFVNDQRGLEHGFTVRERPGRDRKDRKDSRDALVEEVSLESLPSLLSFTMAVRGSLHPDIAVDGQSVQFCNESGIPVLTYAGLKVWDSAGKILPARFEPVTAGGRTLRLTVDESGARYPLTIDPIIQQAYLKASSTAEGGGFGNAVAASGDTVAVSAFLDSSNAPLSGVVYVFLRSGTAWVQQAVLRAPNAGSGDSFGISVAISGDTIVVGVPYEDSSATGVGGNQSDNSAGDSGAAYVFLRSGSTWNFQGYLKASNTRAGASFGAAVAVAGDTVVVGAPDETSSATGINGNQADSSAAFAGAAYVFQRTGGVWAQQAYVKASNTDVLDGFGSAVAISANTMVVGAIGESSNATTVNGNQSNNSAQLAGAAYVFVRSGTAWSQQAYLKASNAGGDDKFGFSVAASGDTVVVGASGEDSSASGVNGNQSDNNSGESGAAYVFFRTGTVWSQQAYLKASNPGINDGLGESVALAGDTIAVGARREASNAVGINGDGNNNNASNSGAAYVFARSGAIWTQQAYLKASNTRDAGFFATAVAVAGNTVVAGTPRESSSASGVNGNQNDTASIDSGAAYIFVRSTTNTWSQQAYVKPYNSAVAFDQFGWSVAVAGDTVVIGAPQESSSATGVNGNQADSSAASAGAAYVFVRSGGVWSQQAYLKASNAEALDKFGYSVAAAGDFVVVCAPEEKSLAKGVNGDQANNGNQAVGAAYVFVRSGTTWSQQAYLKASNSSSVDRFGWSVAAAGETVVVGAYNESSNGTGVNGIQDNSNAPFAGAAYVFVRNGTAWSQQAYLKASNTHADDNFGVSVAIAGDTVVVGAEREDSNATGVNGNGFNTNALNSGAAFVFVRSGTVWSQQAYLKASNTDPGDSFGRSVAVAGDTVVVGAYQEDSNATGVNHPTGQSNDSASGSGAAYVFVRNGTAWSQQAYLKASNTADYQAFGTSVATSGDTVIVGAPVESNSGAAYVFARGGGVWSQQAYLKASNTGAGDSFGWALAVSGGTLVVGAFGEDSNARGVNGNQADNSAPESGAAYVFNLQSHIALAAWRVMWFSSPANSGSGADMADPDHDGVPNLLEFATGQEPLTRRPLPAALASSGGLLEFTYPRLKTAQAEMNFIVEWSDSLAENSWSVAGTGETILSDNGTVQQVKVSIPSGSSPKRFVRLRVVVY